MFIFIAQLFFVIKTTAFSKLLFFSLSIIAVMSATACFGNGFNNSTSSFPQNEDLVSEINTPITSFQEEDNYEVMEKILVILVDMYGNEYHSKVVITDVDMVLSILIAHDMFDKLKSGIYTVVGSSADDLVSNRIIIE